MSLVVWLPLNGNLENQGLSNVTVINNNATIDASGKIGKCYSFNGSSSKISMPINLTPTMSFCAWVKFNSVQNFVIDARNSSGQGYQPMYISSTGVQIYSSGSPSGGYVNYSFSTGVWYHLVVSYSNNKGYLYVNGTLIGTVGVASLTLNNSILTIGSRYSSESYFNGKLNDVRIYDHCLSAKEVGELAKGLVLHYRLSGPGQENLVQDGFTEITCRSQSPDYPLKTIDTLKDNTQYTISFDAKSENGLGTFYCSLANGGSSQIYFKTQIKPTTSYTRYSYTVTRGTQTTNKILFAAYYNWNGNANVTDTIHIKNIKLEEGSIATPWCPHKNDVLYGAMGYNNNIEYDCSGYCRNGTKSGNIAWNVDSPRYTTSYHFSDSQSINYTENLTFLTTGSISFWAKFNTKGSAGWLPFTGQTTDYWIMATSRGTGNFYNGSIPSSGTIIYYEDSKVVSAPTNDGKWHHYAITGINMSAWTAFKINNYGYSWDSDVNYSDIRVYNTVLSAEDIAELYHSAVIVDNTGKSYAYEYFEAQ